MIPHLSTAAIGAPITRLGVSFFPIYLPANELPEIRTGPSSELVIRELDDATVGLPVGGQPDRYAGSDCRGRAFPGRQAEPRRQHHRAGSPQDRAPDPRVVPGAGAMGIAPKPTAATSPVRIAKRVRRRSQEGVHSSMKQEPIAPRRSRCSLERSPGGDANFTARIPRTAAAAESHQTGLSAATRAALRPPRSCPTLGRFPGSAGSPSPTVSG